MASTVSKLYDYKNADVPAELKRWHVTEEEIDESLALLGWDYAAQNPVERAAEGDSLLCRDGAGRTVLLYPGRKLPGAEEAEQAALGRAVGETFSCRLGQTEVSLTVEEILRLTPHPVDEALVALAAIPEVGTLAEYRKWYVRDTEPKKREDVIKKISYYLWDMLEEHSEISLDQAERDRWCLIRAKNVYNNGIKFGPDPHIPEEGTTLLSDEEALAKLVREQESDYPKFVIMRHTAQQSGFVYTEELFRKDVDKFIVDFRERLEEDGYDFDNAYSDSEFLQWELDAYERRHFELLKQAAENYLEV